MGLRSGRPSALLAAALAATLAARGRALVEAPPIAFDFPGFEREFLGPARNGLAWFPDGGHPSQLHVAVAHTVEKDDNGEFSVSPLFVHDSVDTAADGGERVPVVYTLCSPRHWGHLKLMLSSLHAAGSPAQVIVRRLPEVRTGTFYTAEKKAESYKHYQDRDGVDYGGYLVLAQLKAKLMLDMCPSHSGPHRIAVFAETDVSFYSGWWEMFKGCLHTADLCIGQPDGIFDDTNRSVNLGVFALRCSTKTKAVLLAFHDEYLEEAKKRHWRVDQVVFKDILTRGWYRWASLAPWMVATSLEPNYGPFSAIDIKVHHAAFSRATWKDKTNSLLAHRFTVAYNKAWCQHNAHGNETPPQCLGWDTPSAIQFTLRRSVCHHEMLRDVALRAHRIREQFGAEAAGSFLGLFYNFSTSFPYLEPIWSGQLREGTELALVDPLFATLGLEQALWELEEPDGPRPAVAAPAASLGHGIAVPDILFAGTEHAGDPAVRLEPIQGSLAWFGDTRVASQLHVLAAHEISFGAGGVQYVRPRLVRDIDGTYDGRGGDQPALVYTMCSPRHLDHLKLMLSSLHAAGTPARVIVRRLPEFRSDAFYTALDAKESYAHYQERNGVEMEGYYEMARFKAQLMMDMCPDDSGPRRIAVFSETDVAFYKGWWEMFLRCLRVAVLCIGQPDGVFDTPNRSINLGVFALRCTTKTKTMLRDFHDEYLESLKGKRGVDQAVFRDVMSRGGFRWASVAPWIIASSLSPEEGVYSAIDAKIHHATASVSSMKDKTDSLVKHRLRVAFNEALCRTSRDKPIRCYGWGIPSGLQFALRKTVGRNEFNRDFAMRAGAVLAKAGERIAGRFCSYYNSWRFKEVPWSADLRDLTLLTVVEPLFANLGLDGALEQLAEYPAT